MKYKKKIITILMLLFIININIKCYAKYVLEYIKIAAEITINR